MSRPGYTALGKRPELDGVRGVAIGLVMLAHTFSPAFAGGGMAGVQVFFVLSGFLITAILVTEWERRSSISLKRFYIRRALRLLPALFAFVAVMAVAIPLLGSALDRRQTPFSLAMAATYGTNWAKALGEGTGGITPWVAHTWSLGVEEQFYLIWPLILIGMLRAGLSRRAVLLATLSLCAIATAERPVMLILGASWPRSYYGTDTNGAGLLLGCCLGLAFVWGMLPTWRPRQIGLVSAGFLIFSTFVFTQHSGMGRMILGGGGFALITLAGAGLIYSGVLDQDGPTGRLLNSSLLRTMGVLAYSLYLWHVAVNYWLRNETGVSQWIWGPGALLLSVAFALASYKLVEQPFLRRKRRYEDVGQTGFAAENPHVLQT